MENKIRLEQELKAVIVMDYPRKESVLIRPDTPTLLQQLGLKNYPILFSQNHIRNCLHEKGINPHWHGLSFDLLCAIPELLENPVAVYDSFSSEDSVVCVLNAVDCDNLPIIASLRCEAEGQYLFEKRNTNYLTSIYGKNRLDNVLSSASKCDFLLFADKKRTLELGNLVKLQLLEGLPQSEFNRIIHLTNNMSMNTDKTDTYVISHSDEKESHRNE